MERSFKKGDRVKVWSLQSFSGGGFLEGEPAIVKQSQMEGGSVMIAVVRNFQGEYKLDKSYEVYAEQLKLMPSTTPSKDNGYSKAMRDLENYGVEIMQNEYID